MAKVTKGTPANRLSGGQVRLIKKLLKATKKDGHSYSYREIADMIGTSHTTVYRIDHGLIYVDTM